MNNQSDKKNSPEFQLLQRIDQRLENIESQINQVEKRAVRYGAAAGGLSGGLVAVGVLVAKIKLGI